ncbi:MAG: SDR family NAD(P)-dependent oxidoreductase [Actinomycetota bacterium]
MKVLVTGGAGFIGSHIVDALVAAGIDVLVIDNFHSRANSAERKVHVNPRATLVRADVNDPVALIEVVKGVDAVCHQASKVGMGVDYGDSVAYVEDNSLGTAHLLHALWTTGFAGRLILASSMVVYGEGAYLCDSHGDVRPLPRDPDQLRRGAFEPTCPHCNQELYATEITESAITDPRNVYAVTKLNQEHLCSVFARETSVPVTVLRYHNVYGDRMPRNTPYAGVMSLFKSAIGMREAPEVFEDGAQIRDFVHVTDVARANVAVITRPEPIQGTFNISSGSPMTVGDVARELSAVMGGPEPFVSGRFRLGDVRHIFASPNLASKVFGYEPKISLRKGIREFALLGKQLS